MSSPATLRSARASRISLGVTCWILTFGLYLFAVRTRTGRDLDNRLFQQLRDCLAAHSWLPDGRTLARDQLALLAIGVGVVCAACLVTHCRTRTTAAALAVACAPGAFAVVLKTVLTRPAEWSDFAAHNSFPSGTVAGFAGIAAALGYVAQNRAEHALTMAAWLGVGLVSLIVIRAHWHRPSDVAGAVLLALGTWAVMSGVCRREPLRAIRPVQTRLAHHDGHNTFARR